MTHSRKAIVAGTSALLAVGAVAVPAIAATQAPAPAPAPEAAATAETTDAQVAAADSASVYLPSVDGTFAFTQTEVSSSDEIRKHIGDAAKYLCGSTLVNREGTSAQDWQIEVGGTVANEAVVTFDKLLQSEEMQRIIMGCACAGNPADGTASVNAEVTGIPLSVLIKQVAPTAETNTVVFTSEDGYSVALPMDYVANHLGMLVFDVNGAPLADTVGGVNRLWMGGTSANYFARNIQSIQFEERETQPLSPSSPEAREVYQNLPNVGVLYGGEVR